MRLRFRRSMRLVRRRDFQRTYAEGGRARGRWLLVVAAPRPGEPTRLGLSVGRAIWRRAVQRNRLRRLFREAFRLSYPDLPRGADVILIPARPRIEPPLEELRDELVELCPRALAKSGRRRGSRRRSPPPGEAPGAPA